MPGDAATPDEHAELDPVADRYANVICANCVRENGAFDYFCHRCGLPLKSYSTIAPLEQVYTLGHGYREATDRPTRPIIFYGLWLMLGPQVLLVAMLPLLAVGSWIISPFEGVGGGELTSHQPVGFGSATGPGLDWFGYVLVTGLHLVYALILYKATRNYLRRPAPA